MDTNRILLLMVGFACGLMIVRHVRGHPGHRGWLAVSVTVAVTIAALHFLAPTVAGYLGMVLWGLLVLVPAFGSRWLQRMVGHQQYGRARRLAGFLAVLHPLDGWPQIPELLRALESAQRGDSMSAAARLTRVSASGHPTLRRQARFHLFRIDGDWEGMRRWIEAEVPEPNLGRDPVLLTHYLRALGETGELNGLLAAFQRHGASLERTALIAERSMAYVCALAYGGRVAATERVLTALMRSSGPQVRAFWLATAEAAAGNPAAARVRLDELTGHPDAMVRRAAETRIARPPVEATLVLTPESARLLAELEQRSLHEERYAERAGALGGKPLVTRTLAALNAAMFAVEVLSGGSEDLPTLYRLGAAFSPGFTAHDGWRLLASTFLHLGPWHLAMNLLGLLALGPYLERALGPRRYLAAYLASGVLAALTVVLVASARHQETLMVGASGSIMGVIGGMGAVLFRGWRQERARPAVRRLRGVVLILALQVVFDLTTPQISFTAHFAGMVSGFLLCALMKHWPDAAPPG